MKYIIFNTSADYLEDMIEKTRSACNVDIVSINRTENFLAKILLGLHKFLGFSIFYRLHFSFFQIKPNINSDDILVIFDSNYWMISSKYLRRLYKNKIVFWYWNPVSTYSEKQRDIIVRNCDYIYTYNQNDSKKYSYLFFPQFYWDSNLRNNNNTYDFLFVGKDKGRGEMLNKLYDDLCHFGYTVKFHVISHDSSLPFSTMKYLKYSETKQYVKNSRCLIDFSSENNMGGLSLRVLESLFNNKKLITNNYTIRDYSFYSENNILIYDEHTSIEEINHFMTLDYADISDELKCLYSSCQWLRTIANPDFL